MRRTTEKEVVAVLKLDGPARYAHFVKRVVDDEVAWGLRGTGWILMEDNEGTRCLPLWPAKEYAEISAEGDWAHCVASAIELEELVSDLAPKLTAAGVRVAVFPAAKRGAVVQTADDLCSALLKEGEKYE